MEKYVQVFKNGVPVTTASRSPTWAPGAIYVSEEEYERLKAQG